MERTYWADYKIGRKRERLGPFATREQAEAEARKIAKNHSTIMTGYGSDGPWFDIRWPEPSRLF